MECRISRTYYEAHAFHSLPGSRPNIVSNSIRLRKCTEMIFINSEATFSLISFKRGEIGVLKLYKSRCWHMAHHIQVWIGELPFWDGVAGKKVSLFILSSSVTWVIKIGTFPCCLKFASRVFCHERWRVVQEYSESHASLPLKPWGLNSIVTWLFTSTPLTREHECCYMHDSGSASNT